jgi:hypothetical protein
VYSFIRSTHIRDPTLRVGACREGCFHAHTPLHIQMITMHHPPPKHHPSQRPGSPLFQRSVLPSHPHTTPRPPSTRIVYPHRASSTPPLASASTPPHEPYLFLAADPTQRASSYVPLRVHRVTVAPTPSYVEHVVHVAACSRRWRCATLHARGHTASVGRCLAGCVCVQCHSVHS